MPNKILTEKNIRTYFRDWNLDKESREYLNYHSKRYVFLLEEINKIIANNTEFDILDIGSAYQTELIRNNYPRTKVDTMGFYDNKFIARQNDNHYEINLNEITTLKLDKKYDLIILAEVIEHLHIAPQIILNYLHSILKDKGTLLIQTPNACSLWKRISIILGRNPYEMIRENSANNPGHFREYTIKEIQNLTIQCNYKIVDLQVKNYFNKTNFKHKLCDAFTNILPKTFQEGMNIVLEIN